MKQLKDDLKKWEETNAQVRHFIEENDLAQTYLDMAGDMALMSLVLGWWSPQLETNSKRLLLRGEG